MSQISTLLKNQRRYNAKLQLTPECKQELTWWIKNLSDWNGKSFITIVPPGALMIETDASNVGWGATCAGIKTQGQWKESERPLHINEKELLAASLAIKAFTKDKKVDHILLKTDNTTTVSQIMKMGSTRSSSLFSLTVDLWKYCLDNQIMLTAEHLPGALNITADKESRVFNDSSNWKLNENVFQMIMSQFGKAELDLFADRTNHQLPKYISWKPDPTALTTDTFSVKWNNIHGYAFPPICLIGRCLAKVREEQATLIIITPTWQGQPWYATLLQMTIENPILLPQMNNLLTGPTNEYHPMVLAGAMTLAAWKISGKTPEIQHYRQKLEICCNENYLEDQKRLTKAPGKGGAAGVIKGHWIPFQPLWNL